MLDGASRIENVGFKYLLVQIDLILAASPVAARRSTFGCQLGVLVGLDSK